MSTWHDENRKTYRYDFWRGGKRFAGFSIDPDTAVHALNMKDARRIETLLIARADAGLLKPPPVITAANFTLAQTLCEYLEEAKKHDRTWKRASTRIDHILAFFGMNTALISITQTMIEAYGLFLSTQVVQVYIGGPQKGGNWKPASNGAVREPSTRNSFLGVLRKAWRDAEERHRKDIPGFPLPPRIKRFKVPKTDPNPVREQDIARILDAAPSHLQEVIVLTVNTGARRDEILFLVVKEVDWDNERVTFPAGRTKGHKERTVRLNPVAMAILWNLRSRLPDPNDGDARLILYKKSPNAVPRPIRSVKTAWKATLRRAGIPGKYKLHGTRGSFITYLAANGVPTPVIQKLVGHDDPRTTARYTAIEDRYTNDAVLKFKSHPAFRGMGAGKGVITGLKIKQPAAPKAFAEQTPYLGVYPLRGKRVYQASITVVEGGHKRSRYIGTYPSAVEAARARDAVAKKLGGRKLNFPEEQQADTTEGEAIMKRTVGRPRSKE
jgi:integrase